MSVVAERRLRELETLFAARNWIRREADWVAPTVFAIANALTFLLVAPNVNDIYAALARESAALHGVGLTYWFSWFGGGTTPGSYSVLSPYLSALVGAGVLGAIATVAITPLARIALRGTAFPLAGLWVATYCAALNLWSGRVPFALGCALVVLAIVALRTSRRAWGAISAVLAVLSSPVAGAFLALGLVGAALVRPETRRAVLGIVVPVGVGLVGVAVVFGQPGPESFTFAQLIQLLATMLAFLIAVPPNYLRATIWLTILGGPLIFVLPNGLGDNILRLAWYCLPAVVVATSVRRLRTALLAILLALVFSTKQSGTDVLGGSQATASPAYYESLIQQLDLMQRDLLPYRLEVVENGTHTGAYALLDHAMLARGYEYQDDRALNSSLNKKTLDPTTYKIWLQDNAVGFVAISSEHRKQTVEYALVSQRRPAYLQRVWQNKHWTLYKVRDPNPVVNPPVRVVSHSQSTLVLHVPCTCSFIVRVHYSRYLDALPPQPVKVSQKRGAAAKLRDDGFGWTTMTTPAPGNYTLSGSLTVGLLR